MILVTSAGCSLHHQARSVAGRPAPVFSRAEVAAYQPKGPSECYRHICLEYNTPTRAKADFSDDELRRFFSLADPVEYARFCEDIHLDAALMLAVPQGGYTAYCQTEVGEPYPGMPFDFFGETIKELHKRDISALGYIITGWNLKYAAEHPDVSFGWFPLICLNSPYTDLVIDYSREVLTWYPIDGLRYDIMDQPTQCRCPACRAWYRELFGEEMPDEWPSWERRERFRLASITRHMQRLYDACKEVKPSVEIWQNWFNDHAAADLRAARYVDLAYLEFADPFRQVFLDGVFGKGSVISGKILKQPYRRLCLALGAHCYSYFEVDGATALPTETEWFHSDLAPFYAMVEKIEPYIAGARPVPWFGVAYNEATRFRYQGFDRGPIMRHLRGLTEPLIAQSRPPEYLSSYHLPERDLSKFPLLLVPDVSGFTDEEIEALRRYVREGGRLLITGSGLCYDADGAPRADFALASEMGLRCIEPVATLSGGGRAVPWKWSNHVISKQRARLEVSSPGPRTVNVWMREGGARIDRFVLTRDPEWRPAETGPESPLPNAPPTDPIVFEAENFDERSNRGDYEWQSLGTHAGFAGESYLQAQPSGAKLAENYEDTSAELRYTVYFPESGTWYVWVRQACDSTGADSIHVGLDGKGLVSFDFNTDFSDARAEKAPGDSAGLLPPLVLTRECGVPAGQVRGPVTRAEATGGSTPLWIEQEGRRLQPLLHVTPYGAGQIAWLAASADTELTLAVIEVLAGSPPVETTPRDCQAILTWQPEKEHWILHLLSDGDYTVRIRGRADAQGRRRTPHEISARYPGKGWNWSAEASGDVLVVRVAGSAKDRMLVLR